MDAPGEFWETYLRKLLDEWNISELPRQIIMDKILHNLKRAEKMFWFLMSRYFRKNFYERLNFDNFRLIKLRTLQNFKEFQTPNIF